MKTIIIVASRLVYAEALAKSQGVTNWVYSASVDNVRHNAPPAHGIIFCETARQLSDYEEIITCVKDYGWDTPPPLHKWGIHSATLSGAFKLLEVAQGTDGLAQYSIYSKGGSMGVYLSGLLVMHKRDDGMLRYAKKGEGLK